MKGIFQRCHPESYLQAVGLSSAAALAMVLSGCGGGGGSSDWVGLNDQPAEPAVPTIVEANINTLVTQIGGATQDIKSYNDGTKD